jgi:hypothetical protein
VKLVPACKKRKTCFWWFDSAGLNFLTKIYDCLIVIKTKYLKTKNYSALIVHLKEVNWALIDAINSNINYAEFITFYFEFELVFRL